MKFVKFHVFNEICFMSLCTTNLEFNLIFFSIDAEKSKSTNIISFVNDGGKKSSNCIMKKILVNATPHLCLFVKQHCEVPAYTELLYDYGEKSEHMDWRNVSCCFFIIICL